MADLSTLCSYYLDCLSKDNEDGLSCRAIEIAGNLDYAQIFTIPQLADDPLVDIFDTIDAKKIINKVKVASGKLILQLGYPINIKKGYIEPIFLIPFNQPSILGDEALTLTDEIPRLNIEAIKSITGIIDDSELSTEIRTLSNELGFNNSLAEQLSFEAIVLLLKDLRPQWDLGQINPTCLSTYPLKKESKSGIYNSAAIFFTERSKFTQGLEKELTDLAKINVSEIVPNILTSWINNDLPIYKSEDKLLIEPLPLNDEQRIAVNRSLQAPLTVVTGPPGTGKSQVVTSIILNAIYQGQTVLFASKNHKAVDVVIERIEGLAASSHVINKVGDDSQLVTLSKYLSKILDLKVDPKDTVIYNTSKNEIENLAKKISEITSTQQQLIEILNRTEVLKYRIENCRDSYGNLLFNEIRNFDATKIQKIEITIKDFEKAVLRADRDKQTYFTSIFWLFYRNSRYKIVKTFSDSVERLLQLFNINGPNISIDPKEAESCYEIIDLLNIHLANCKEIRNYFQELNILKSHKSFFQLSIESKLLEDPFAKNSRILWGSWLKLFPNRLSPESKKDIGDYLILLDLIIGAKMIKSKIDPKVWFKYYSLQPKITNILSCWAVTSLSAKGRVPFESGFFDLVIIDEASQCDIASALPLLYRAKRAVIIGDEKQLNHISKINESEELQLINKFKLLDENLKWSYLKNSLFKLAFTICSDSDNIVELKDHHRSHADIIEFSNKEFYNDSLRVATNYDKLKMINKEPAIKWMDVKGIVERPLTGSSINLKEAESVVLVLKGLISKGYTGSIGVVTPFNPQVGKIRWLINKDKDLSNNLVNHNFWCDTVYGFQGDERDTIIFSTVVAEGMHEGSKRYLKEKGNLFNVAITRARAALIVVGDKKCCSECGVEYLENFTKYYSKLKQDPEEIKGKDWGYKYPFDLPDDKISEWEAILYEALYKNGIRTVPQYPLQQYKLDMALFSNDKCLDIEVDGETHHRSWDGELCRRDQLRNKRLIELNWEVMRFWVYQLRDDMDGCIAKVQEWIDKK